MKQHDICGYHNFFTISCHRQSYKNYYYNLLKDRKNMIFKVFFQCWPVDWSINKKASVLSWLCVSKLFKVVQSIFLHCSNNIAILQMFAECHHQIKSIRRNTLYNTSGNEEIIVQNLISYLSGRLQDITTTFRRSQNDYLKSKSWFFIDLLLWTLEKMTLQTRVI